MLVTGVQAVGAKGVSAVQGAIVDPEAGDACGCRRRARRRSRRRGRTTAGDPQPVVFPRSGVPMDQRPVAMRQLQAVTRYRADGDADHDHEHDDHPDAA